MTREPPEQTLANIERLKAIAREFEEMADGYQEKADQLLRDAAYIRAACVRIAAALISDRFATE